MEKHTHKSVGPSFVSFCRGKRHQAYLHRFSLLMNYKFSPFPSLGVHPILKNIDVEHKTSLGNCRDSYELSFRLL